MPPKLKPNSSQIHALGKELATHLDYRMSFVEIGQRIGVKTTTVQYTAYAALGKLAHRLKNLVNE